MLKKCYGLFLGLVVLTGSACVTPTHASSASTIITMVRPGSPNSATEERVAIYNNSSFEVEVTNWCLTNKSQVKFACLTPETSYERIYLPAYSYATFLSRYSVENNQQFDYSVMYEPTNNSSGSITASGDTISIINADNVSVDQFTWSSSIGSTQHWARTILSTLPDLFVNTNSSIDWQKVILISAFPSSEIIYREIILDPPIDEPEGPSQPPVLPELPLPAVITELLPNAVGSDTNNEWIEIYNPNQLVDISLSGYQLAVGANLEKKITLNDLIIKAGQYVVITNTDYTYSLLNTSSKVALYNDSGVMVSEVLAYTSPGEGKAWALIDDVWQYTDNPSPGSANIASSASSDPAGTASEAVATLKPCADNQYRSPETNRCRLISSSSSAAPAVCKQGQERNPETNRCRAIATSTAAECKAGQERNPETNRCRNIKKLVETDYAVKGATTQQQGGMGWYMWAAIAGIVLLILGYAVWEWRDELKSLVGTIKAKFAGKAN